MYGIKCFSLDYLYSGITTAIPSYENAAMPKNIRHVFPLNGVIPLSIYGPILWIFIIEITLM